MAAFYAYPPLIGPSEERVSLPLPLKSSLAERASAAGDPGSPGVARIYLRDIHFKTRSQGCLAFSDQPDGCRWVPPSSVGVRDCRAQKPNAHKRTLTRQARGKGAFRLVFLCIAL